MEATDEFYAEKRFVRREIDSIPPFVLRASSETSSAEAAIARAPAERQRQANVRAGVAPGFALQDRLDALKVAAADLKMPAGYTTAISGRGRELALLQHRGLVAREPSGPRRLTEAGAALVATLF